ncbi:MAG: hypothetical protein IJ069_12850 [Prevotella sp.]|nr:hypothetical protein [Prevotella sp.]MBQ8714914.1 hypothetical protein [Prevotella sp.]
MKKMMIAALMCCMVMSVYAQSENNGLTFDRMSSYLELTTSQVEPVKQAFSQFEKMMDSFNKMEDKSKQAEAWERIKSRHMKTMKEVLDEKQYEKYVSTFNQTANNTAERMQEKAK